MDSIYAFELEESDLITRENHQQSLELMAPANPLDHNAVQTLLHHPLRITTSQDLSEMIGFIGIGSYPIRGTPHQFQNQRIDHEVFFKTEDGIQSFVFAIYPTKKDLLLTLEMNVKHTPLSVLVICSSFEASNLDSSYLCFQPIKELHYSYQVYKKLWEDRSSFDGAKTSKYFYDDSSQEGVFSGQHLTLGVQKNTHLLGWDVLKIGRFLNQNLTTGFHTVKGATHKFQWIWNNHTVSLQKNRRSFSLTIQLENHQKIFCSFSVKKQNATAIEKTSLINDQTAKLELNNKNIEDLYILIRKITDDIDHILAEDSDLSHLLTQASLDDFHTFIQDLKSIALFK